MLVLVLDTSTPAVTAALADVSGAVTVLAERRVVDARAHGEALAPGIEDALAAAGAVPRDLAAVVAGLGPGPFTGLRVGLVTAASISQALSIPSYGVCSLDAIGAPTTGTTLVATDARRKEIYWGVYVDGARLTNPAVHRPGHLPKLLAELGITATAATGDGALRYPTELGLPVSAQPRYPAPAALAELAAARVTGRAPAETLTPLYLRRPDAVEPAGRKPVSQ